MTIEYFSVSKKKWINLNEMPKEHLINIVKKVLVHQDFRAEFRYTDPDENEVDGLHIYNFIERSYNIV